MEIPYDISKIQQITKKILETQDSEPSQKTVESNLQGDVYQEIKDGLDHLNQQKKKLKYLMIKTQNNLLTQQQIRIAILLQQKVRECIKSNK